ARRRVAGDGVAFGVAESRRVDGKRDGPRTHANRRDLTRAPAGMGTRPVPVYLDVGYFASLRWSDRRWMPRTLAASEMLPWHSISTRLMCSHSTRSSDIGRSSDAAAEAPSAPRSNAARISSASAGLVR